MKLLSTPTALTDEFKRLINQYRQFDWAVAWASVDFDAFRLLKINRSKIRHLIIGTHFHQTHPNFISTFSGDANVRFRIDEEGLSGVFHPKVFLFSNNESSWEVIVGSANFTKSAFSKNVEYAVLFGSEDQVDGLTYSEILEQITALWKNGKQVSPENLIAYRARWEINRARLGAAAGHSTNIVRVANIYDCELLNFDWPQFYHRMQTEPDNRFQDRLHMLAQTRDIFNVYRSLHDMPPHERQCICGTAVEDIIKWRLFGSMAPFGVLKKRIIDNDVILSNALDLIPTIGPVSKAHYDGYIGMLRTTFIYKDDFQGLAVATRLLCIKRPDQFVCIDSANRAGLTSALGLNLKRIEIDNYWNAVIEPILESPWYQSPKPADAQENAAWQARVAMIDALYYKPQ